ncbi:hypothetical protein Vadar_009933 [Vaccinium darrowii]|uniref:Uncharacterized protein n=1 Tax=Vaccinium darrowii TaxID=229202 RepID=A0ACB7YV80_9ERIC|nr:hypothetical protein Vadar_009933 [Vaccinium darrowii]
MNEGWSLVTKKRYNRRFSPMAGVPKHNGESKVTTVYVDNLSDDMDAEWLRQIFSKFGRMMDVFIPRKRSKHYKSKFGFVRFDRAEDAYEAIASLNGISIRDKKMLAKVATFGAGTGAGAFQSSHSKQEYKASKGKEVDGVVKQNAVYTNSGWDKSFADVVRGKLIPKRLSVKPIGNEWLERSVVAKLKSLSAMESVRDVLHCKGVFGIDVKDMGGLWVVLTFSSAEQLQSALGGDLSWLSNWFSEFKKWCPDTENERRRNGEEYSANDSVDEANSRRDAEDAVRERSRRVEDSNKECFEEGEVRESVPHLTINNEYILVGNSRTRVRVSFLLIGSLIFEVIG